jgi:hypothetical protein
MYAQLAAVMAAPDESGPAVHTDPPKTVVAIKTPPVVSVACVIGVIILTCGAVFEPYQLIVTVELVGILPHLACTVRVGDDINCRVMCVYPELVSGTPVRATTLGLYLV